MKGEGGEMEEEWWVEFTGDSLKIKEIEGRRRRIQSDGQIENEEEG